MDRRWTLKRSVGVGPTRITPVFSWSTRSGIRTSVWAPGDHISVYVLEVSKFVKFPCSFVDLYWHNFTAFTDKLKQMRQQPRQRQFQQQHQWNHTHHHSLQAISTHKPRAIRQQDHCYQLPPIQIMLEQQRKSRDTMITYVNPFSSDNTTIISCYKIRFIFVIVKWSYEHIF